MRRHPLLAAFTFTYVVVWTAIGLALDRPQVWAYAGWMAVAVAGVVWAEHQVRLSTTVLAVLSLVGFAHMAGGTVTVHPNGDVQFADTVLYAQSWWTWVRYDLVIHFFGLGAVGIAAGETARRIMPSASSRLCLVVAVLAANAVGAWVEIGEYVVTLVNSDALVGDYANNASDLVANLAGSLAAAWWYANGTRGRFFAHMTSVIPAAWQRARTALLS